MAKQISDNRETIFVSIIVPVYSGEAYLRELIERLGAVRNDWENQQLPCRLNEVIFVNDASIDGSADLLDRLAADRYWVTVLHNARNYGQHPATTAGILHASGDWVVTMDEDLQHPPEGILDLLRTAVTERRDVVYAQPSEAVHKAYVRDLGSRGYKKLMQLATGNKNLVKVNSFRLIRGDTARAAASVCMHETYFDVALSWFTNRFSTCSMALRDERFIESGKSGYSLRSLLSHARRMLFSSQVKLMRVGTIMGLGITALAAVFFVFLLVRELMFPDVVEVQGWVSLMLTILLIGGSIMFMVGLILEYLSLLVQKAHGKPVYFTIDRSLDSLLANHPVFAQPGADNPPGH